MDNQIEQAKRKLPAKPNRKHFTETNVLKLPPKKGRQYLVWDQGTGAARGLAILVSPTGTASYRTVFYFKGSPKPHWMHLGRVGEIPRNSDDFSSSRFSSDVDFLSGRFVSSSSRKPILSSRTRVRVCGCSS